MLIALAGQFSGSRQWQHKMKLEVRDEFKGRKEGRKEVGRLVGVAVGVKDADAR